MPVSLLAAAGRRMSAKADSRHAGTACTKTYGVDAAFMSFQVNARNLRWLVFVVCGVFWLVSVG